MLLVTLYVPVVALAVKVEAFATPLAFVLAATGRAYPAPLGLDETVNIYRQ